MKVIFHLLKKDLARYAWAILILVALTAVETYLLGTDAGLLKTHANQILTSLTFILGPIVFFVVIIMVVQEETLADPDSYWLARPISRSGLFLEKMIFVVLLIAIGVAGDVAVMFLNDGASRIGYAAFEVVVASAIWIWQIFLAAQTRSLPRYLLLAVSLFVGFYAVTFGSVVFLHAFPFTHIGDLGILPRHMPRHLVVLIQSSIWLLGGIGTLLYLYRTRRILRSWIFPAATMLLSSILSPADSFFGIAGEYFASDHSERLRVEQIRTGNSFQVNGEEFIECEAVLASDTLDFDDNTRISISYAQLTSGGTNYSLTGRLSLRPGKDLDGRQSISLGSIKRSEFDNIKLPVDLMTTYVITVSEDREVARLAPDRGKSFHGNGNRVVIRETRRDEDRLDVTIGAVLPRFSLEPTPGHREVDAFEGRFSFALVRKDGSATPVDFRIPYPNSTLGKAKEIDIQASLPSGTVLGDHEIVVQARETVKTISDFIRAENVEVVKR